MSDPLTDLGAQTQAPGAAPPVAPAPTPAATTVPPVQSPAPPAVSTPVVSASPAPTAPAPAPNPYAVPKTVADKARAFDDAHARAESSSREVTALREVIASRAAADLAALPSDAHRAAVREMAGDDPVVQLKAIAAMQRHGIVSAAVPAGATTAPPPSAPAAAPAASDPDLAVMQRIDDLRSKGAHILAASLESQHAAAVARVRARPATN